jgi:hypothetical protein
MVCEESQRPAGASSSKQLMDARRFHPTSSSVVRAHAITSTHASVGGACGQESISRSGYTRTADPQWAPSNTNRRRGPSLFYAAYLGMLLLAYQRSMFTRTRWRWCPGGCIQLLQHAHAVSLNAFYTRGVVFTYSGTPYSGVSLHQRRTGMLQRAESDTSITGAACRARTRRTRQTCRWRHW